MNDAEEISQSRGVTSLNGTLVSMYVMVSRIANGKIEVETSISSQGCITWLAFFAGGGGGGDESKVSGVSTSTRFAVHRLKFDVTGTRMYTAH